MSTILIVDDDPRFRAQARDVLAADGFSVIGEAVDGASGLEAAQTLRPDFVLLDIGLGRAHVKPGRARVRSTPCQRPLPWLHPQGTDLRDGHPGAGRSPVTLRLVLADDSILVREGVARLLAEAGFDVVAQVGEADALLRATREHLPDVAIVDIRMPPTHTDEGLRAAEAIRAEHGTAVGILVLSQHVEPSFALRLVSDGAGGVGYLLKDRIRDLDDFADAIRRIAKGGSAIDPAVVAVLVGRRSRVPLDDLTERERTVLALMAEGRSNQAIADRLSMARKTVEAHIANIFSKLELLPASDDHRRVLAVLAHLQGSRPAKA